jgi:hypothetical protein
MYWNDNGVTVYLILVDVSRIYRNARFIWYKQENKNYLKSTSRLMQARNVKKYTNWTMEWLAQRPDLNIIANVWL